MFLGTPGLAGRGSRAPLEWECDPSCGLKGRRSPARGETPGVGRTAVSHRTLKGCRSGVLRPFRPPEGGGCRPDSRGYTPGGIPAALQAARDPW